RPAERRRRDAQRADRVADVVLAVAEGALTVLPRLAPVHGRQSQEERLRREAAHQALEERRRAIGAPLEPVLARRVMKEAGQRAELGNAGDEHIALGRM